MIIILTYGKVASQSLQAMAEREFPGEVYYSHGLQTQIVSIVDDFARHARTDSSGLCAAFQDNSAILEGLKRALQTGDDVTIISGVRDPVMRSLSAAVQNLHMMFDDCVEDDPSVTAENLAARIESLWLFNVSDDDPIARMCQATICAPLFWLSEEIEKPFGLDILSHPFDVNRGFALIRKKNISLLLYRQESAPQAIEVGLQELFPGRRFTLPRKNQAKDKSTVGIYETLNAIFRLPRDKLISIYANPYVRHFFSEEEISSLVTRWQSLTAPKLSTETEYDGT